MCNKCFIIRKTVGMCVLDIFNEFFCQSSYHFSLIHSLCTHSLCVCRWLVLNKNIISFSPSTDYKDCYICCLNNASIILNTFTTSTTALDLFRNNIHFRLFIPSNCTLTNNLPIRVIYCTHITYILYTSREL